MMSRSPARAALRRLTDSLGSPAMIQVNSNHEMPRATTIDAMRSSTPSAGKSGMPIQSSTVRITVPLPSAVSAMVMTMAAKADSSAARSDSLALTNPGGSPR